MDNSISDIQKKSTMGPLFFIRKEFYDKPESEWPSIIKKLQLQFGYPIEIKNINDKNIDLNSEQKKYLLENKMIITGDDFKRTKPEIWYALLKGTDYIIRIHMSAPINDLINKKMKGIYYIMLKGFQAKPQSEWQHKIEDYEQKYANRIKLITINDVKFNSEFINRLDQGYVVGFNFNTAAQIFYKRIPDSDYILEVEPFGSNELSRARFIIDNISFFLIFIFSILIALALYLWMRPIWSDLNKLNAVTTNFGRGNFKSRSDIPKKSAIWHLSNTFNNMAIRISKLITSHKDLTNAVSHELRTPLSRLRFAIEMLNEEKDESLKQEFVDSMGTDIDELELLVSELLSYAKFDRENPELKYNKINIGEWLEKLIDKILIENIDKKLSFINSFTNKSLLITIDPKLLDRALNNIIRNALRYAAKKVDVTINIRENKCCILIEDDGAGIPEKDRDRILQPFTRLDYSRNRKTGGYGLGLSIVQQIVKWHNGCIIISTSHYGGASFEICIPLK